MLSPWRSHSLFTLPIQTSASGAVPPTERLTWFGVVPVGTTVKVMREPNYVQSTGRTTVNLRDPDGWRLQLVDADRKAPQTQA